MLDKIWLIPLLPLIGTAVNGLLGLYTHRVLGRKLNKGLVSLVAIGVVGLACVISILAILQLLNVPDRVHEVNLFTWLPGTPLHLWNGTVTEFKVNWGYRLDPLSAVMIFVVTFVGFWIHVYSIGYMWEDPGYWRFFTYLNLFMFAMLTLVLANNFLLMFVGWEGVGLCSYLLIGFWFHKKSAADAGKKAFVVNRVGDAGFMLGMMLIIVTFGSLNYTDVFTKVSSWPVEVGWGILTAITIFLFVGATGKSAQIPLHTWLPDAMEGPTPVSALIHAATMVTAGVYMVTRCNPLYTRAPISMEIVMIIGVATAIFAASIGLVQRDIKRVLAYSTVSQLGYMFTACGVGAFAAGIFHLFTHAFFKALLFLGSGSVIHGMHHEQDMFKMGGLKKYMPVTYTTMFIGTLAIAGIFPFAGFFSKDDILWQAFNYNKAVWLVGWIAAWFTAFYMFRLIYLTFYNEERFETDGHGGHGEHGHGHGLTPHESPGLMTIPLVILAAGSLLVGFLGLPGFTGLPHVFNDFLKPVFHYAAAAEAAGHESHGLEIGLSVLSVAVALFIGFVIARRSYVGKPPEELTAPPQTPAYTLLYNKYYVDELYDALFVNRAKDLGTGLWVFDRWAIDKFGVEGSGWLTRLAATISGLFDKNVVDRAVDLLASIVDKFSYVFRSLQTGIVPRYAMAIVVGILVFVSVYIFFH
jgi:NADH-quinone oxidoreductase subunit L